MMNIFYLSHNEAECAQMHNNKHTIKMIIEYCQLMSTAHRVIDGEEYTDLTSNGRRIKRWRLSDERESQLMKASHINHPSAIWCRENLANYRWLYNMWSHLLDEYTYRYGKVHACARLKDTLRFPPTKIRIGEFFAPTPAMPDEVKIAGDSLASYRNYYNVSKRGFATWQGKVGSRPTPAWYTV
jgi:hypothetical protein